jgi:four helix bundle protein
MSNHRKLLVSHRANALSIAVHRVARTFKRGAAPGLKAQLLRSVESIPANIVEGAGRGTRAEFAHFVGVAIGSANETETHLMLALGLEMIAPEVGARLLDEVDQIRRMLFGLRKFLLSDPDEDSGRP